MDTISHVKEFEESNGKGTVVSLELTWQIYNEKQINGATN